MRFPFTSRRAGLSRRTTPIRGAGSRHVHLCTQKGKRHELHSFGQSTSLLTCPVVRIWSRTRGRAYAERRRAEGGRERECLNIGRGAQVALTIPAHQRTYPSTTTHPPCLPLCFWIFEHWPSLVTPYPTHLREGHNGAPPKALNSKLSFRPA